MTVKFYDHHLSSQGGGVGHTPPAPLPVICPYTCDYKLLQTGQNYIHVVKKTQDIKLNISTMLKHTCICSSILNIFQTIVKALAINPLTPRISLVIPLTVYNIVPVTLVQRIWYKIKLTFVLILITCLLNIILIL